MLDVKRGAAPEGTIVGADLEDLAERGLDQRGRHADRGHHPHPKDRAGPADGERDGDAGDVPGADPRRQPDTECLEGRDPTVLAVGSAELTEHAPEVADLNESGAQREIDANRDKQKNQDVAIQGIAKRIDQLLLKKVQICFLLHAGPPLVAES